MVKVDKGRDIECGGVIGGSDVISFNHSGREEDSILHEGIMAVPYPHSELRILLLMAERKACGASGFTAAVYDTAFAGAGIVHGTTFYHKVPRLCGCKERQRAGNVED